MKKVNLNFIPQNVAPIGAKQLAIFDSDDNLVTTLPLGGLGYKPQGDKLYSFGALSDIHLPYAEQNASTDFQEALTYFNNVANVDFICISGDMSDTGTDAEWLDYKNHVDTYSPNIPVHLSAGNHDVANGDMSYDYPVQYTGNPLWYSFEQNNDVFIMFGLRQWQGDNVFHNEALQWLYEILEENKDKRCFVFQHEMRLDGCGNAHGLYGWDGLSGRNGQIFLSLMEHYKNVIWFHGHSHTPFKLQSVQPTPIANYDRLHGCHSVHIPSLAIPRYGNSDVIFDAEGYVVDVYENGIHLRGIDFIEKEFVPIASYWIDTTPDEITGEYIDDNGIIKPAAITLPENAELVMNERYSSSGGGYVSDSKFFAVTIPVKASTQYTMTFDGLEVPFTTGGSTFYCVDENKTNAKTVNGSNNFYSMTSGVTILNDGIGAEVKFRTASDTAYIVVSILTTQVVTKESIKNYVITIDENSEETPEEVPEEVLNYTNLVPTSIDVDGTIYNSIGYKDYTYISTSGNVPTDATGELVTTGLIEIPENYVLYVYGATFNKENSYCRVAGYNESKECVQVWAGGGTSIDITDMGDGIQKIEMDSSTLNSCSYVRFSLEGFGDNLYIYNKASEIVIPEGTEVKDDTQFSESGGGFKDMAGYTAYVIPVEPETSYTFNIHNIASANLTEDAATMYELTADQAFNSRINGSKYIYSMTDTVISEDCTSAEVNFVTTSDARYIAVSIIRGSINLSNIKITLEAHGKILKQGEITDSVTWTMDKRLSSAGDADKDDVGTMVSDYILVDPNDVINIYGITSLDGRPFYINFYKDENFVYNIPLSNADMNPTDSNYAYAEYNTVTQHLTVRIKDIQSVNSIRVCCIASTVEVYRNAEKEKLDPLALPEGSELYLNQRFSQSGGGLVDSQGQFAVIIPIDGTKAYKLSISNLPNEYLNSSSTTLYKLDETKTVGTIFNGSNFPQNMTTGVTISEDFKSAVIDIPAGDATVHYLAFTYPVDTSLQLTEEDLAGIVIDLNVSNV